LVDLDQLDAHHLVSDDTVSNAQRQLRVCLAAILVAGLLLAGIATGHAGAAPCRDGESHQGAAMAAQLVELMYADAPEVAVAEHGLAPCCSTAGGGCTGSAVIPGEPADFGLPHVRAVWHATASAVLHGLGDEVTLPPPRIV
jgi:hypothetical protein